MHRIAVWNTAFLGDAVLTLPLIQTLKAAFPAAAIDFYTRAGLRGLFYSHPAINEVIEYDKRGSCSGASASLVFMNDLRSKNYDLWVGAHQSMRSAVMAKASKAPIRIGYNNPWFNRLAYTHAVSRRFDELPEIERLLELVRPLGISVTSNWPELKLSEAAYTAATSFWQEHVTGSVLGLHPGSVWATKRWPVEYFAELGLKAIATGMQVMLFAGPGEEKIAAEVKENIEKSGVNRSQLIDMSGRLGLPELAAYLGRLSCYVSNDSGPMHLAWCQHTPVVALFGATVPALGFAPRGEKVRIAELAGLACRPCSLHGPAVCPEGHHNCMRELKPDLVWEKVLELIE